MKILYVENHPRFARLSVQTFLASHVVAIVPTLGEARALLSREDFELILLDYDLDDGKGTELIHDLKGQAKRPLLIATSSHDGGNKALFQAGADAVCGKMNFANIETVIAQLLQKKPSRTEAMARHPEDAGDHQEVSTSGGG